MMRDDEQIDRAAAIGRAHQVEFLVPGEIAQMGNPKSSKRDNTSDRLSILTLVDVLRLEGRAIRISPACTRQWCLDRLAGRGDDAPVKADKVQFVSRFRDRVLRFAVQRRLDLLQ